MTAVLLLLLKLSVAAVIVAIGLDSTWRDVWYLRQRPGLLLRSVVAMYILVPLVALAAVSLLDLAPGVKAGLLVIAVSAGAPLLPRKLLRIGDGAYIFSLVVLSSLLAIFLVPAWLAALGPVSGTEIALSSWQVGLLLAESFFAPLVVGMLLRRQFPQLAERMSGPLMATAGVVLTLSALTLLALHPDVLLQASWKGVGTLAGVVVAAITIGHLLGGPMADERTALAIACATRHLGIAVLVAASLPGPGTAVIVSFYILTSALLSFPYLVWRRRCQRTATG